MENEMEFPKNPSNRDILREVRAINSTLDRHETDIASLKEWKTGVQAVDRYVAQMKSDPPKSSTPKSDGMPPDWTKIIITALGLVASAIAVIAVLVQKG